MTIDEVIEKLEDYKKLYGNMEVEVSITNDGYADYYNSEFAIKNWGIRKLLIKGVE